MGNMIESTPANHSLETKVQLAEELGQVMRHYNIREAVAHNGDRYKRDLETGEEHVATQGVCITMKENTVTIVMQRPGATMLGTLNETTALTQQLQGAMNGVSQSTISRRHKHTT